MESSNFIVPAQCVVQDTSFSYIGYLFFDGSLADLIDTKTPPGVLMKHDIIM